MGFCSPLPARRASELQSGLFMVDVCLLGSCTEGSTSEGSTSEGTIVVCQ